MKENPKTETKAITIHVVEIDNGFELGFQFGFGIIVCALVATILYRMFND